MESPTKKNISNKSIDIKEKAAKKAGSKKKDSSTKVQKKQKSDVEQIIGEDGAKTALEVEDKKSSRAEDEVVTYDEIDYELKEIPSQGNKVLIGPPRLTRFERARITGARSLQLSLGAPSLIRVTEDINDSISLATTELDAKALPISIRRILPNGVYQDIPIDWMK